MIEEIDDSHAGQGIQTHGPNGSLQQSPVPVEKLVLDATQNKYQLILQTIRWAKELRAREGIPTSLVKLLDRALEDILTGRVTPEAIQQAVVAQTTAETTTPEAASPQATVPAEPAPAKAAKRTKKKTETKKKKK